MCGYQSLEISYVWITIQGSTHFRLAIHIYIYIYPVVHAESASAVRIYQFLHPEENIKRNQPLRVSISHRIISYYTLDGKTDSPLIRPFTWINKEIQRIVFDFNIKFRVRKLLCFYFSQGPGGFRELRGAGRNNFHLSWYL